MPGQAATHGNDLDAGRRAHGHLPPMMPSYKEADVFARGYAHALQELANFVGVSKPGALPDSHLMDKLHHSFTERAQQLAEVVKQRDTLGERVRELEALLHTAAGELTVARAAAPPCLPGPRPHSHYFHDVRHLSTIDIYRMIELLRIEHPALQHAFKKVAAAGKRGAKDELQDAREAIDSINRFIAMRGEDSGANK